MRNPISEAFNTVRSVLGCIEKPIPHGKAIPIEHSNKVKIGIEFQCPKCAKDGKVSVLREHKYVQSRRLKYTCPNCNYSYTKFQ